MHLNGCFFIGIKHDTIARMEGVSMNNMFWNTLAILSTIMVIISVFYGKNESLFYFSAALVFSILFINQKK